MTIDWWTLGIQTVNVAVLVWLLQHFFWRPVAAMIALRRTTAEQGLAQALAAQDQATAALAAIAQTRSGFATERDAILAAAHAEADKASAETLDGAAKQAASRSASAQAALEQDRTDAQAAWSAQANALAVEIAQRLAARLDGPAISAAFLDWLLAGIRALPAAARQAAGQDGAIVEAVSAQPLPPAEQDRYRTLIADALGAHPHLEFKADPALIAGIELHGDHFAVTNSWRADLGQILAQLNHAA